MPNNGDLRLVISKIAVDTNAAIPDINKALAELSKKVNQLDIKLNIDTSMFDKFIQAVEKIKSVSDEQNKVVKETIDIYKKLDGTTEQVTTKIKANGEIIEKTRRIHDQNKKSIQGETKALDDQRKTLEQLLDENDRYSKDVRTQTRYNSSGEVIGATHTLQDQSSNDKLVVNTDNEGFITNYKEIEESLKNAQQAIAEEIKLDNERVKNYNETEKIRKQIATQALKDEEQEYSEWVALQRKKYDTEQQMLADEKQYYLAHQENAKRDIQFQQSIASTQEKINDARRRFAADSNVQSGLTGLESQLAAIKNIGDFKVPLKDVETGLKRVIAGADSASSHVMGIQEAFSVAMQRFPIWIFYQNCPSYQ